MSTDGEAPRKKPGHDCEYLCIEGPVLITAEGAESFWAESVRKPCPACDEESRTLYLEAVGLGEP